MRISPTYEEVLARLDEEPKTWLITGAAGFIGSHLVETLLQKGQRVVGLDDFSTGYRHNLDDVQRQVGEEAWARFTFHEGDIRRLEDCARSCEGVDYVLHQAALGSVPRSIEDPLKTHQVNVAGFVNMLVAARDAGVRRFVYASSSSVYGDHPGLPKVEEEIGTPLSPYAVTKRANELYARTFQDHYGLETIGLRYFNVFGRRQDPDGPYAAVIPKWIGQMLAGERCTIYGDGETSRDFCHVANAVQANLLAAIAGGEATGRYYNVAVGERTTLNELHEALCEDLSALYPGREVVEPKYGEFRPGDVRHSLADTGAATRCLGYAPALSARDGLREVMSSSAAVSNKSRGLIEDRRNGSVASEEDSRIADPFLRSERASSDQEDERDHETSTRPLELLRQLNSLLNRRERWQIGILAVALIGRAAVEMVGVGSIAPFMSVVSDPSVIHSNRWLRWGHETFGFSSDTSFLMAMGIAIVVLLAVMNTLSALTLWGMFRFSWGMHHRLSNRLLSGYLAQPYSFFVQRNSASLSKSLLTEVNSVTHGVMAPILNVGARSLVVLAITGLLIVVDPLLALIVVLVLGGAYGVTYLLVRAKQRHLGRERVDANQERYKVTNEAFGGIKAVKVLQREDSFASRFAHPSWIYSKATATNHTIAFLPRYLFETIAFGGIVLIVLYFLQAGEGLTGILPTISLYAFAGYRLMPELQQLFVGLANIRFNRAALDDLMTDLDQFEPDERRPDEDAAFLPFRHAIRFESVTFRYPTSEGPVLEDVSLMIPRDRTIGLVGESGSGKTTLVDLLLGLYEPIKGRILIDDEPLNPRTIRRWQKQVGYVPQHIYLCDDTLSANIAFGVPSRDINQAQVERAARIAHLHDFIGSLPRGYETFVGERGVRLSGGQRQRVGIARALYHDPAVLVLDEATSSLDGATEGAVMEAIRELAGKKTIVLIAHRLTTVMDADRIYLMEEGRVVESGNFAELTHRSQVFRTMAKLEPSARRMS